MGGGTSKPVPVHESMKIDHGYVEASTSELPTSTLVPDPDTSHLLNFSSDYPTITSDSSDTIVDSIVSSTAESSNNPIHNVTSDFLLSNSTHGFSHHNSNNNSTESGYYFGLSQAQAACYLALGFILFILLIWMLVHVAGYFFGCVRRNEVYKVEQKRVIVNHDVIRMNGGEDGKNGEDAHFLGLGKK